MPFTVPLSYLVPVPKKSCIHHWSQCFLKANSMTSVSKIQDGSRLKFCILWKCCCQFSKHFEDPEIKKMHSILNRKSPKMLQNTLFWTGINVDCLLVYGNQWISQGCYTTIRYFFLLKCAFIERASAACWHLITINTSHNNLILHLNRIKSSDWET